MLYLLSFFLVLFIFYLYRNKKIRECYSLISPKINIEFNPEAPPLVFLSFYEKKLYYKHYLGSQVIKIYDLKIENNEPKFFLRDFYEFENKKKIHWVIPDEHGVLF